MTVASVNLRNKETWRSTCELNAGIMIQTPLAIAAGVAGVRAVKVDWAWHDRRQRPVAQIWYIGDPGVEQRVAETVALRNGFIPPYKKLYDLPIAQNDEVAGVVSSAVEWGVVGDTPAVYNASINQELMDPILLAGMDIQDAMESAEAAINAELTQREDWNIIERNYKNNNLMISDQP